MHRINDLAKATLPFLLLLHVNLGWSQLVLTSDGASILKISGLPAAPCGQAVAFAKYSATPQNQATLAGQVQESLKLIPPEDRLVLEAGKAYRYSLQVSTSPGNTVRPPLSGRAHGESASILPVYAGVDAMLPVPSRAGALHAKAQPAQASGYVQFNGLLQFDTAAANGFLCIPYCEKAKHDRLYTTNIIIPVLVRQSGPAAIPANRTEALTKASSATNVNTSPSGKRKTDKVAIRPIIGVTANVQFVRQSVRSDVGLNLKGTPRLLSYTRACPTEEEPEAVAPELSLKVFPNPTGGAANVQYDLPESGEVTVLIYDLQGKVVHALLPTTRQDAGPHQLQWQTRGVPSGMYIVRVRTAKGFTTGKVLVTSDLYLR